MKIKKPGRLPAIRPDLEDAECDDHVPALIRVGEALVSVSRISGCEGGDHAALTSDGVRFWAPGAGKTSLAVPLAAELGFALVCKDKLKETLHDALGAPAPDLAWSRKLGAAAMELLWALAADAPSVVIEANFRPRDPYQRRKLSALAEQPVEVYCQCHPELAARRYKRPRQDMPPHSCAGQRLTGRARRI